MAVNPSALYTGQIDTSDVNYPYGKAQSDSNPTVLTGQRDGTPLSKEWVNDVFGLQQALLTEAGITPSGTSDNANSSQYLDAIKAIIDIRNNPMFEYDIPMDGTTNALPAFQNMMADLNSNNKSFTGIPGRYVFSGIGDVTVQVGANFNGITIDASNWDGAFRFFRRKASATYTAGDGGIGDTVINAFEASSNLNAGSSYYSGIYARTELDNSFVKINTDQNFFQYRDNIFTRTEYNHIWNKGVANSPLLYPMTGVNVTSIEVYPMEDDFKTVRGLTIDVTGANANTNTNFVFIETSYLDIEVSFLNRGYDPTIQPQLIFLKNSAYIKLKAKYDNSMQSDVLVAYGLGGDDCYHIELELYGDGDGWGLTDMNEFRRTFIKDSVVSRIDFHRPFFEFIKVANSTIGDHGFTICGMGDIFIDDCELNLRIVQDENVNPTLILGRADSGGFVEGDLIINNLRIANDETFLNLLFNAQNTASGGSGSSAQIQAKPAGSPVEFRFFKNIYINNIHCPYGKTQPTIEIQPTRIVKDGLLLLKPCETFTLENSNDARTLVVFDFEGLVPAYTDNEYDCKIDIKNSTITSFKCYDADSNFNVQVMTSNVTPFADNYSEYMITAAGNYQFSSTQMHRIDFKDDADVVIPSANVVNVEYHGSTLKSRNAALTSDFISATLPSNVSCTMYGGIIRNNAQTPIENLFARGFKFYSTKFYQNTTEYRPEANPWALIKPEFFNEKQIVTSQTTPHSFAANNVFEDTSTVTALFQLERNSYVFCDLQFTNQLSVDGIVAAQVVFEGTNDGGSNYTTYATLPMGYISKTTAANTGIKTRAGVRLFLSRNLYEEYRATVQLRCIVDGGTSFPLSQGNSLVYANEIELRITYI